MGDLGLAFDVSAGGLHLAVGRDPLALGVDDFGGHEVRVSRQRSEHRFDLAVGEIPQQLHQSVGLNCHRNRGAGIQLCRAFRRIAPKLDLVGSTDNHHHDHRDRQQSLGFDASQPTHAGDTTFRLHGPDLDLMANVLGRLTPRYPGESGGGRSPRRLLFTFRD